MRDLLFDAEAAASKSPEAAAQEHMRPVLPKRFYKQVSTLETERGWLILLDGRKVKTPAKAELVLPTQKAAELVASEWDNQKEKIDPATMPMTRLANTAIDGIATDPQAVAEDIIRFASNDLVFYRSAHPVELVELQQKHWDHVLDLVMENTGARFETTVGIMHHTQPKEAVQLFSVRLAAHMSPLKLACLHTMTSLCGSGLIAWCLAENLIGFDDAWQAAHVDENFNISLWGEDYEAQKRFKSRHSEMNAAHTLFKSL